MAGAATTVFALDMDGAELEIVRAALAGVLDKSLPARPNDQDAQRLGELVAAANRLDERRPFRLTLTRADAEAVRAAVTMLMAARGYVVGRPAALAAMVTVRQKLDRLLARQG